MRSALRRGAALTLLCLVGAGAAEPPVPTPQGFLTDLAGAVSPPVRARITALATELQQKTGAEIAVLTVDTTAPLDDFTYAMRVAEAWKPGRKGEDTGAVVLVAVRDRRVRIVVGYGLEGILPDGLLGEIQDREMVPEFRAGRLDEGIWRGVAALASRIAESKGVTLTGAPRAPATRPREPTLPLFVAVLIILCVLALVLYQARARPSRFRRRRGGFNPGDFGGFGGGGGGFGGFGGSGDSGGFGGGSFGGGGAGRSW